MRQVSLWWGHRVNKMALMSRDKETGASGAPGRVDDTPHYQAFLSYSHHDSAHADWLHKALERFVIPKGLVGRITTTGAVPRSLSPIFRDRHELAASSDLGQTIRVALKQSRFLIVLCSPAAAGSRWVNEEILAFKKLHGERCVLAAIVAGEPWASEIEGREAEECFPPALREKIDRKGQPTGKRAEPIAAYLREARDGREAGKLKLIAGMLGLGLDDLVRREQQRRQKRLTYLAAASLAGMTLTSGLAVFAFDKRDEARDQRREAEGLVGFMLGDLRKKLEPIGRLDALDAVGSRALQYFESQNKSELSDAALTQRSKALTLMGEIASTRGDLDGALRQYREAWAGTAEALRRKPDDPQRIFDHAQNVFWVGSIAWKRGRVGEALAAFESYKRLAEHLVAIDPGKPEWHLEGIYADTNLGILLLEQNRFRDASAVFRSGLKTIEGLAASDPKNRAYQDQLSETLAYLSQARESAGFLDEALALRERQLTMMERLATSAGTDAPLKKKIAVANRALGRLFASKGDVRQGLQRLHSAVVQAEELTRTEPNNTEWARNSATSLLDLGELELASGNVDEAGAHMRAGCAATYDLVQRNSTVVEWRSELRGDCLRLRARLALTGGMIKEGRAVASQLVGLARSDVATRKGIDARFALVSAEYLMGEADRAAGDSTAAEQSWRRALAAWPSGTEMTPRRLARQAMIFKRLGRNQEARSIEARLEAMGYRHPAFLRDMRQ